MGRRTRPAWPSRTVRTVVRLLGEGAGRLAGWLAGSGEMTLLAGTFFSQEVAGTQSPWLARSSSRRPEEAILHRL